MGQIERYGLYVLVMVIFLILGVAIWGGDANTVPTDVRNYNNALAAGERSVDSSQDIRNPEDRRRSELLGGLFTPPDPAAKTTPDLGDLTAADLASSLAGSEEGPKVGPTEQPVQPEPVVEPPKETPKPRTHTVRKGDTMVGLAKKYYGDENLFGVIQKANPKVKPSSMLPGTELVIPTDVKGSGGGAAAAERKHTVADGESPWTIAERYYGKGTLWKKITEANNIKDPGSVKAGTVLVIPK